MSREALTAMLSVQGQQEFASVMDMMLGKVKELGVVTGQVSEQMTVAGAKMDAAFGAQRVAGIRAMNGELVSTKGHLRQIVSMLGGGGLLTAFGIFEGVKNAARVQTNQMQWVSEAGVSPAMVPALKAMASRQAGQGLSQIDAGSIIRQVESAYGGKLSPNDPRMQGIITNSVNLSAISGGAVSVSDAASLLIPALQADPSLKNNAGTAARIINAMVGSGNMQTQDAFAILKTQLVGTASSLGIGLSDLAPIMAFGADTRSGQQAAPFARTFTTSLLNLSKAGANKPGQAEMAHLMGTGTLSETQKAVNDMLHSPGGLNRLIDMVNSAAIASGNKVPFLENIYGGIRGGAAPLAISGHYDLYQAKQAQYNRLSDPMYYNQATGEALTNAQHRGAIVRAEFSNLLTNVGEAALPLLEKTLPALTEMFKVMGNPNVLHFVEAMLLLRGATMLSGGAGAMLAAPLGLGALSKLNPYAAFRGGLAGRAAARAGTSALTTGLEVGGGSLVADAAGAAGGVTLGGVLVAAAPAIAVAATAAALTIGGAYLYGAILHQLGWDKGNKIDLNVAHQAVAAGHRYAVPGMGNRRGAGSVARSQVPGVAYSTLADMPLASEGNVVNDSTILAWAEQTGIFPMPEAGTMASLLPRESDLTDAIRKRYAAANGGQVSKQGGHTIVIFQPGSVVAQNPADAAKQVAAEIAKQGARK